jgi:hypothetical protein
MHGTPIVSVTFDHKMLFHVYAPVEKLMIFIELDLITKGDRSALNHVLFNPCALQARSRQSH